MMLSRFSDVLQSAADVLAPPASRIEDFEYHWKMVVNFYQNYDESSKLHIEETRVPHHLHQMLQLLVEEESEHGAESVGPCLEAVMRRRVALLDALAAMVDADQPAGARCTALGLAAALLRRTRRPCLHSAHVLRPLQRMLLQCSERRASPTEREEVELLLTLCGLVRREPGLANLFTAPYADERPPAPDDAARSFPARRAPPRRNPLFDVEPPAPRVAIVRARDDASRSDECGSCEALGDDKFLLVDPLLAYLDSADSQVVLRACEGVMIVCSLPEDDIANLVTASPACERLAEQLLRRWRAVPADTDPADVEQLSTTWAYVSPERDAPAAHFPGRRQLVAFFSWLDFCDTLMKECHPIIAAHLARVFRSHFLEAAAEALCAAERPSPRAALLATALLAKCLRVIDSSDLINEFSNWLVGEGQQAEWPLLLALIDNCLSDDHDLTLETLRFFEVIIEKGTEHSMDRLVLSRVCSRGYCAPAPPAPPAPAPLQDERDRLNDLSFSRERERNREALQQLRHEELVSSHVGELLALEPSARDLHHTINSFLLLLPRAVLSDPLGADYEHYVHDAQRHYQLWLDTTSSYSWRRGAGGAGCAGGAGDAAEEREHAASSTHSYDSRPEDDMHADTHSLCGDTRDETTPPPTEGAADPLRGLIAGSTECRQQCPFTQKLVLRSSDAPDAPRAAEQPFDEGPFLRMLFDLLAAMPDQPYQVNLHVTAIVSKLALLPHPQLHEYLLRADLPAPPAARTLHATLRALARRLAAAVPRVRDHRRLLEHTRRMLMSEDPAYDDIGSHNQLIESVIVLEEFCKELAAIAFVKHQHQHQHLEPADAPL